MNLIKYFMPIFLILNLCNSSAEEVELKDAVKDYSRFQTEINRILNGANHECTLTEADPSRSKLCSMKNYCDILSKNKDSAFIYSNADGEKIQNPTLERDASVLSSCLKEVFQDEIAERKEEIIARNKLTHLQKLTDLNKKLKALVAKKKDGATVQTITSELLNMSLKAQLKDEEINWDKNGATKDEMLLDLNRAEKNTKTKLSKEAKTTLLEMHYLLSNPDYQKEADDLEETLFPKAQNKNIFYNWDLLTDSKKAGGENNLNKNRVLFSRKAQDAYNLFKETKNKMITYLQSKKTEQNKKGIERAIERINTIKFNPPELTKTVTTKCLSPSGFYNSTNHSFTLCPQSLESPRTALVETIAHEIAHSFDPCKLSKGMSKKLGPEVSELPPFELNIKMDRIVGNYANLSLDETLPEKNTFQEKMKYENNPFSKTLACLQTDSSVGAKTYDLAKIKENLDNALNELKKNGHNNDGVGKYRYYNYLQNNIDQYFQYSAGCDFHEDQIAGVNQLEESFAEKISSEIIALDIANGSREQAEDKILQIVASSSDYCKTEADIDKKMTEIANKYRCPEFFANRKSESKILQGLKYLQEENADYHPEFSKRLDRILLAHPEIRKALQCPKDPKGATFCE